MSLSTALEDYGKAKSEANTLYMAYKDLKTKEDVLKGYLLDELEAAGLQSAKGSDYSATITNKSMITIQHEATVMEWLQNTPDVEADLYIGIKPTSFQTLAKSMLKGTGEIIPGTELVTSHILSIRTNKKEA